MKALKGIAKGLPGTGLEAVAGTAAFYAHRMLSTKVAFVQSHPLIAPGAILVLGHVMKKSKKLSGVGTALCGVAGYAGATVYELQKATAAATAASTTTTPAAAPAVAAAPATTAGFEDTGMLVSASDIGALVQPGDISGMNTPTAGSAYSDAYGL